MDEYKYARNSQSLNPIEKTEAEQMINNREKIRSDYIKEQQHKAYMQTLENEKNAVN